MPARKHEEGQVIIVFALMLTVLLLAADLVLDGSFGWVKQRQAQNAADFAAIAGANSLRAGKTDPQILATITTIAGDNGATVQTAEYTDGNGNPYTPPKNVGSQSDLTLFGGVKVVATDSWTPFFPALWGGSTAKAGASGTARFTTAGGGSGPCALCALGLNPEKWNYKLDLGSGSTVDVAAGSVMTNGGIRATSKASLTLGEAGAKISFYGPQDVGGGTVSPASALTNISAPILDPYAFLSDPVAPGSDTTYPSVSNTTVTLNPGIYPSIYVGAGNSVIMNPGTYYITNSDNSGTGVVCKAGGSLTGIGVTIVFLGQAPFAPSAGCTLNLSAPANTLTPTTAIPYPGMLIYFARTNTSTLTLWSGSDTTITGSIYAKAASLTVQGGSVTGKAIQSMIVVDNINVKANAHLNTAFESSLNVILPFSKSTAGLVQ